MGRRLVGVALLLHAMAHASVIIWTVDQDSPWLITIVWAVAMLGLLCGGLGLLGWAPMRTRWWPTLIAGMLASFGLLLTDLNALQVVGILVDGLLLAAAYRVGAPRDLTRAESVMAPALRHRALRRVGSILIGLIVAYIAVVALVRPVYLTWGTTPADREMTLPGDEMVPNAHYRVDHAVTIGAPADSVWGWIAQLGQDRGGFYSHAWLERLFGDDIRNADEVKPEWQHVETGGFVHATQRGYLGGIFGDSVGWPVTRVDPGRALVLKGWGAFVLVPVDSARTRFIIRTRGEGTPSALALVFGPLSVLGFEPAHFIMQRAMMRGIRDRAERMMVSLP